MLSERERLARDEFNDTQNEMQAWLEEIEAERVDVHYDGVGLLGRIRFWLMIEIGRASCRERV